MSDYDDEERFNEEEAAEMYKQYLWERDLKLMNEQIDRLFGNADDRRKELRENAL